MIQFLGDTQHSQTIFDLWLEFSTERLSWEVVPTAWRPNGHLCVENVFTEVLLNC